MDKKIAGFIKDMEHKNVKRSLFAPPFSRLLWCCGLTVRPLMFNNFVTNFVLIAIVAGSVCSCVIYIIGLAFSKSYPILGPGIACGIIGGWLMSQRLASEAKRIGLPSWEEYTPPES